MTTFSGAVTAMAMIKIVFTANMTIVIIDNTCTGEQRSGC